MVVAGDFNRANLKNVMPNFHQHITCATRGKITLDTVTHHSKEATRLVSLPVFGKLANAAIFLLPEYKHRVAGEMLVMRDIKWWSDQSEAKLQDVLSDATPDI